MDSTVIYPLQIDSPLEIRYDAESKTLSVSCYQFASDHSSVKMALQFSAQATQQMLRAVEHLQSEFGLRSEAAGTPPNLQ
jgi:hypothetical protein